MANYIIDTMRGTTSEVLALALRPCDGLCDRSNNAAETGERFLQSAVLLEKGQFLVLQIGWDEGGNNRACVFSSADAEVSGEDFQWIFQKCADMNAVGADVPMIWNDGSDNIYELCRMPEELRKQRGGGIQTGYCDDYISRDYFRQLLDEIQKTGAALQFRVGVTDNGMAAGALALSMSGEMTLRMRTLFSMAFQDTELRRLSEGIDDLGGSAIPAKYLLDGITGILEVLIGECSDERESEEEYGYDEEYDEEYFCFDDIQDDDGRESGSIASGSTPLEELGLSIRSHNCLKRAGINSVEEVRRVSTEDLLRVRNLNKRQVDEIRKRLAEFKPLTALTLPPEKSYMDMLDELVGLGEVKEQVRKITAFVKMRQDMKARGMSDAPIALNMEFVGNPGTAKTTVARILAGIFNEIGLLESSGILEVGRADLVAAYEGQTADKVQAVFRRAKGKMLFIDEAYALVEDHEGAFGDEAINTIVQEMENHRDDTVVIFAGYPDRMKEFLSRNPGLRSRVPFRIPFFDYSVEEMVQIVELETKKRGFSLGADVKETAASICRKALRYPDAGNGRFCRNLVEGAILRYAVRAYGKETGEDADRDFLLRAEDFVFPENIREMKGSVPIGFKAS